MLLWRTIRRIKADAPGCSTARQMRVAGGNAFPVTPSDFGEAMTRDPLPTQTPPAHGRLAGDSRSGSTTGIAGIGPGPQSIGWVDDAWRQQRTPGAYEWWYFDAIDPAGNGVAMTFYDGFSFHPNYLMHQSRYRRRLHRNRIDGLLPNAQAEAYPVAHVVVYQGGRAVTQFLNQYPPGSFEGDSDLPEFRLGPNRVTLRQDGSFGISARGYPMQMTSRGPRHRTDQLLSLSLSFAPTFPGVQHVRPLKADSADGATHQWILAAPHGHMTGHVQHISTGDDVALLDFQLDALGYHDHVAGGSGLGIDLRRRSWGRALGPDWALVWQHSVNHKRVGQADAAMLFRVGYKPIIIEHPEVDADRGRLSPWFLHYDSRTFMHGGDAQGNSAELEVRRRAFMESHPHFTRTACRATFTVPGKLQLSADGLADTLRMQRLHWPVISDLMLMSILCVRRDDPLWRQ